jgi:steroid delta-isomerase-like uncharacterized protein
MSVEDSKALIRRMYETMNQRNWDEFDEMFAPDYVHHSAPGHDMNFEDLKQAIAMSTTAFPDLQATIEEMIAEGDKVMVRWTQSATHTSEFMGVAPTGKRVRFSGINIFRVRDAKIAEDTPHWDFSVILQQLQGASQPVQSEEASPTQ